MYTVPQYKETLEFFCEFFGPRDIKWCLGASGALLVHGVKVSPKDIDIVVNVRNLPEVYSEFQNIFSDNIKKTDYLNNSIFKFELKVSEVPSEVVGFDIENDELVIIEWERLKIPVHLLEKELLFYIDRPGKEGEIELIKQRIQELHKEE